MIPTRDHTLIRIWAAKHDAVPAEIKPLIFDSTPSILYFLFGNARDGTPEIVPITWEDFFARFDVLNLSIVLDTAGPNFEIVHIEKASRHSLAS